MTIPSSFLAFGVAVMLVAFPVLALDDPAAPRIDHGVFDGKWSPPPPPVPLPERPVISEMEYVLPSEGRSIIVQEVVPPEEPPPPPVPPPPPELTAEQLAAAEQRRAEWLKNYQPPRLLSLSCTVYDFKATRISWYHKGSRYVAWSNLDWNDFAGLMSFVSGKPETRHSVFLGLGNINTVTPRRPGRLPYVPPENIPELPQDGPGFVLIQGDDTNTEAVRDVQAMHDLYRTEGTRLREARLKREQAQRDREVWLLANPPQPRDTIIQFGRRSKQP